MNILVTGGSGYIGSHCVLTLIEAGYNVIALDNFANSVNDEHDESIALQKVSEITGKEIIFYKSDLLDLDAIENIFSKHKIDAVIHFAAMKAVGESMEFPLLYYKNNLIGVLNLLIIMEKYEVHKLVFSSSCTVYGEPDKLPITESNQTGNISNVYGRTKYFIEEMLRDISRADSKWKIIALRYFNPVGAHISGKIGEDPTKKFTNLMPYISQVAMGKKPSLEIYGDDYDTLDGTGLRDYIHVMDLATGHIAALKKLMSDHFGIKFYNLGTGKGWTVLQLIHIFENVNNVKVPYVIKERRNGDISAMYADVTLAENELDWKATKTIEDMCRDFWRWQTLNPNGYRTKL